VRERTFVMSLRGQHKGVDELFTHPRIEEHFAGREADAFSIDAIFAELHHIGETGLDVHSEDGQTLYTCTLVLRSAEGSVTVTAESAMGAALGCLLETLQELHMHAEQGITELDAWRDEL
jgi:hypothetical protein